MAKLSKCNSCGAEIWWVKTVNGRNMPVDADPATDGNLSVDWDAGVAHHIPRENSYSGRRYSSHFSTCPNADHHRKKKPTAAETDAAVEKAIAAVDKKPDPNPVETVTEFAEEMMMMIGEAITDDVEAWEPVEGIPGPTRCIRVTWRGHEFQIDIMQVNS